MTSIREQRETSETQARAQLDSIIEMVEWMEHAQECDDDDCQVGARNMKNGLADNCDNYHDEEAAREFIEQNALSVQVRSDWHNPGETGEASEFEILLCTGGPACRIVGDLDEHGYPSRPRLQHQDWGTPWTEFIVTGDDRAALETYCAQFYFGEGA